MRITVTKLHDSAGNDNDMPRNPEERLNLLEQLRLQAGKFLYEYPARLRRVITVIRAK